MVAELIIAFNVVECLGLVGALVILLTSLFPPARSTPRLSTWYLVLVSSAFYNLAMLLLAFGRAQSIPEPNFTLCFIQSALIYSAPIWLAGSVCTFALQLHLTILHYAKHYTGFISHESPWLPTSITALFLVATIVLLITAGVNPEIVHRNEEQFYCHFTNHTGVFTVAVFGVIFAIIALTCEAGFSILSILTVAACALFGLYKEHGGSRASFGYIVILTALMASAGVPLLGLNESIIHTWMFWRKRPEAKLEAAGVRKEAESSAA
ncbi:hypothetical protein D9757_012122 [Collybiopsis confluens]|uniref:Uncharacterized protein n=1 Tax=Collybiopsis confluens TaxID=2823264 RepID=A0A8H5GIJ7_9AGAR|nr:hypothetical protein D9757_012122 [Collybiopsis confluens]